MKMKTNHYSKKMQDKVNSLIELLVSVTVNTKQDLQFTRFWPQPTPLVQE